MTAMQIQYRTYDAPKDSSGYAEETFDMRPDGWSAWMVFDGLKPVYVEEGYVEMRVVNLPSAIPNTMGATSAQVRFAWEDGVWSS